MKFLHTGKVSEHLDVWSGWHFFGTFYLAGMISWIGLSPWLALAAGYVWEMLDGIYSLSFDQYSMRTQIILDGIWDKRGFSWVDLVLDAAAVTLWILRS